MSQFYRNAAAMTSSISLDARIGGKSSSGERASSDLSDVVGEGDSPEDLSHTADLRGKGGGRTGRKKRALVLLMHVLELMSI